MQLLLFYLIEITGILAFMDLKQTGKCQNAVEHTIDCCGISYVHSCSLEQAEKYNIEL